MTIFFSLGGLQIGLAVENKQINTEIFFTIVLFSPKRKTYIFPCQDLVTFFCMINTKKKYYFPYVHYLFHYLWGLVFFLGVFFLLLHNSWSTNISFWVVHVNNNKCVHSHKYPSSKEEKKRQLQQSRMIVLFVIWIFVF